MNNSNNSIESWIGSGFEGDNDGVPPEICKTPVLCKKTLSILGT